MKYWIVILGLFYALFFVFHEFLFTTLKGGSLALFVFPIVIIAWFLGLRVSIYSAAINLLLALYFLIIHGVFSSSFASLSNMVIGGIILFTTATIMGRMSDIGKDLSQRSSEQATILELIPDILMLIGKEGKVHGYQVSDPSDLYVQEQDIVGYDIHNSPLRISGDIMDTVNRAIETGEIQKYEYELQLDKGVQYFEMRAARKSMQDALIMIRNITDVRQAEQKRMEFELRQQYLLKQDALSQLTADIVHNFNNILSVIMTNIAHLHHNYDDINKEQAMDIFQSIENTSIETSKIFHTMMAQARADPTIHKVIDIHQIILNVKNFLNYMIGGKIDIECDLFSHHSKINGNENNIYNTLLNLGLNARDAMPNGGVITFSTQLVQKLTDQQEKAEYIQIRVSDTGIGMDSTIIPRIFEPFFTTKGDKGLGIGLAGVKRIVEEHRGNLEVKSQPSVGSTFIISLPLSPK